MKFSMPSSTRLLPAGRVRRAALPGLPALPGFLFGLPVVLALLGLAGTAQAQAQAQYKVVAPDGSITYTDRPPAAANAKVTSLNRRGTSLTAETVAASAALPLDLRQAVQRHPVTLYAGADCTPCDNGRRLLQLRGVPYTEKRILNEDDAAVLERAVGSRTVPALTIGPQPLRGFSETDWTAFLDAAGYPRESKLPRGWQQAGAQAASDKTATARPAAPVRAETPPEQQDAPEPSTGVRF